MGALSEFVKHHVDYGYMTQNKDIDYKDVFVLSIGTGTYSGKITAEQAKKKGKLFWATRISDIMMRGVNRTTDYEMKQMMEEKNYLRLSIEIGIEEFAEMSRADKAASDYLINETRKQVTENNDAMNKLRNWLNNANLLKENIV
jgi:hypothetical protein